ncbi:RNA polymerase II transcription elongation factor-domain-containing protein [Phlebopus sp. FC_14]|nr:RNA polymerase II transcription elongation factor-domain-containing protein [Phlebopus sp. FC_14]
MASADTQWMPVTGRHKVDIGSSLGRALKARKGVAASKRSNLPDRDFYSFRYNFKPESIDPAKHGSIEVKRGKDTTSVTVERPSTQAGENHLFKGTEQPVKEYDCVLIYDEELGTFTLEKIDAFMSFSYERKVQTSRASNISHDVPSPSTLTSAKDDFDLEKELERDLYGLEDADGEPEDDFEEVLARVEPQKEEEEEEEEEEELPIAAPKESPPAPPPVKPKPARDAPPKKQDVPPRPKAKSKEILKSKKEPEVRDVVDSDLEEVLDFGVPARPAKRQKPLPPTRLALPDASISVVLPSSRPPQPQTAKATEDSESEGDWYPVVEPAADNDAEEIDVDAFGREMELQLEGSDDDILAAAMSPEPAPPEHVSGRPISLNQFAGGQLSADEDSTSSSEDSEDD